jgi:dihydroneopterin aldolase/2-amino-4-hydroxy-6-hydroxymethyldihydropteridine diphosphokinase
MTRAFIGIGSNIEPAKNTIVALRSLARQTHVTAVSMVYCTSALGRPEQSDYFNCVAEIETDAPPAELKRGILRTIETKLGRERSDDKYAPRTIDLDLIIYGDLVVDEEGIKLPDPDIMERPFLAIPLFELAPDLVLAGYNLRIGEIAARIQQEGMRPLEDYTRLLRKKLRLG